MKMKNIMKSRKTTDSTRRKGRDAQADPDEDYLDQDYDDYDNEEEERIRRIKNKGLVRVSYLMVALFLSMAGYLIYFNVVLRDDINNNQYNTKQSAYQEQIIRGNIYSADGNVLAQTDIAEDGTESRSYPYSNLFAHIVGYATNGKSGIESVHNYDLLSSHASILDQIRELHDKKGMTIILVSHSMEDIARYADRLMVMNHGEKVFDGAPKDVFEHYKELEAIGLAAPQVTYITHALKEHGVPIGDHITTVEEARDAILKLLNQ